MAKKSSKNTSKKRAQQKKQQAKQKKEQLWFAIAAVALAVLAIIVFTGGGNGGANDLTLAPEINTQTAKQMFDDGAFMLDVRTPEEWNQYHVDGATLIPLDELEARVDEVPRDREIIVICNSGNRSQVGRDILLNAGFANVTSIAGGIQGWMSAGYDFVSGE